MDHLDISRLVEFGPWLFAYCVRVVRAVLLAPGGDFALASLFGNLVIALIYISWRQRRTRTGVRLGALLRGLFPRRFYMSKSSHADMMMAVFNLFIFGLLFGWALMSAQAIGASINGVLVASLGAMPTVQMSWFTAALLDAIVLFLAYELGYWVNHYLSHRWSFMWEFHKVHHTADVLTPLTNFRVHPIYILIYLNIIAVFMGSTYGVLGWTLGRPLEALSLFNVNVFVIASSYLIGHLHHSHVWMPFTGWLGKILISPAHHQIHHSTDPAHFNKNFGGSLAIFDWMFGTLCIPQKRRERLSFGLAPQQASQHTAWGCLIEPVLLALGHVRAALASGLAAVRGRSRAETNEPVNLGRVTR